MKYFTREINIDGKHWQCRLEVDGGGIQRFLRGKNAVNGKLREPELFYMLKQVTKPGMCIMDLGANLGYLTMWFAGAVGEQGNIYAVEPDPLNIELLKANINNNNLQDIVECREMGISNFIGASTFYPGKEERNLGSIQKHKKSNGQSITIKVETLSGYLADKERMPELIKMDVEGHEVEILEGGYEIFKAKDFPCVIVMELHPTLYSSEKKMEAQLRNYFDLGFKVKYVASAGVPIPDQFKTWGYEPIETFRDKRGVYDNFTEEHAIQACCYKNQQWMPGKKRFSPKIARYLMIERV